MNDRIDLSQLKLLTGTMVNGSEWPTILPDAEGVFVLSLNKASAGVRWSSDRFLVLDMHADMDRMAVVYYDFVEHRPEGEKILSTRYFMIPGRRVKLAVRLSELDSHRFFLPTYPGTLKGHVEGEPTDIDRIDEIRIRLRKNDSCRSFSIYGLELTDDLPDMRVIGDSLVDELGQRKGCEWPGKMHSDDELVSFLRSEHERAVRSRGYPKDWSPWGGWTKLRFGGTGFFRTHHDGKRWWLVDPDGCAFYSNGLCYGARMGVYGFTDRMESLFDWLPDFSDPAWKDCWTEASEIPEFAKRNGRENGVGRRMFNFARANMIRAFGPDGWWNAWVDINAARMRRWGINTVGIGVNNYGDERTGDFLSRAQIPFVVTLKNFPLTTPCIYRDFPDVFSPEYAAGAERFAREQLLPYADNPYLIGYFITNEPEWLFQESVNPAERVLAYDGSLYSKDALIDFLRNRYAGNTCSFNRAWGLSFSGFDDLRKPFLNADSLTAASRADLSEFRDILIAKYSEIPSRALRQVDPNHLNLGMRYNKLTPNEFAGNGSFDVCSFNCYSPDPASRFDVVAEKDVRPGLIGEWHVAGNDMRAFASGLVYSPDQIERTKACVYYMEQAMAHRTSVGSHYFELNDQPVLGRFDGECMQHGLISVCNVPYPELTSAMEALADRMYDIVAGNQPPTSVRGRTIGNYS